MPRDVNGVYSPPSGTYGIPDTPILSAPYNAFVDDLTQDANTARPVGSGGTGATSGVGALNNLQTVGVNIASDTTIDLGAATGDFVNITGTSIISSFGTTAVGCQRVVRFTGAATLTHSTILRLPGGQSITAATNDIAIFRHMASGVWICATYERALAAPLWSDDDTIVFVDGAQDIPGAKTVTDDTNGFRVVSGLGLVKIGGGTGNNELVQLTTRAGFATLYYDRGQATSGFEIRSHINSASYSTQLQVDSGGLTINGTAAVLASRSISTGSGLSGGGNLSANRTLSVDNTVVRTTGNQSLSGTKNFTGTLNYNGNPVASVYTGSAAGNTSFPIGTPRWAYNYWGTRNSTASNLGLSANSARYGSGGTQLAGTWRHGGEVGGGEGGSLCVRTA